MDEALKFMVEHGGWGSIGFIFAVWGCVILWRRNNELQDARTKLIDERNAMSETVKELRKALEAAIEKAAADRDRMLTEIARLKNGGRS